jgi:hypothetical protein
MTNLSNPSLCSISGPNCIETSREEREKSQEWEGLEKINECAQAISLINHRG